MTVQIDPEFAHLLPPLTAEEDAALTSSLLADGCRDALIVWHETNILLDGHNRWRICQQYGLPFGVRRMSFSSRAEALTWVILNQFARRSLTPFARSELALKLADLIAARARLNQGRRTDLLPNSAESPTPINTRAELARLADVSGDTIHKTRAVIAGGLEPVISAARAGHISIDRAYRVTRALADAPPDVQVLALALTPDEPEKIGILKRLYGGDTFDQIAATGGFAYGDEMQNWCDFAAADAQTIARALKSVSDFHRHLAALEKDQDAPDCCQQLEAARREIARLRQRLVNEDDDRM